MTSRGAPLLLRMFGGRTKSGRSTNLLAHTEHVLKSGYVVPPTWLAAVQQCAPGVCVRAAGGAAPERARGVATRAGLRPPACLSRAAGRPR